MTNTTLSTCSVIKIEGGKPLKGKVRISGSKNSVLPLLFSTLLTSDTCLIEDSPDLLDVKNTVDLLEFLGAKVQKSGKALKVFPRDVHSFQTPIETVRKMRASVLSMGPLLARFQRAVVGLPGGCSIGKRPIDQHLKFFSKAGAKVEIKEGYIFLEVPYKKPVDFSFDIITVTGTENAMLYLSSVKGKSVLRNIALEPEVMDLARALRKMGVKISLKGRVMEIEGKEDLSGFVHKVIPDRIEAGTFMVATVVTGGEVIIENVRLDHMEAVVAKIREVGGQVENLGNGRVVVSRNLKDLKPSYIETAEYPGFPTDMQAQFGVMLCIAKGRSEIYERIFENRFQHFFELKKMGAKVEINGRRVSIEGVDRLKGAKVNSTDLRASASLVIAGLIAEGTTIVKDVHHLDRGYERLEEKLKKLGASVERLRLSGYEI